MVFCDGYRDAFVTTRLGGGVGGGRKGDPPQQGKGAATRRNMRREERVTVQGPVKKQHPDGMSRRGKGDPPPELCPSLLQSQHGTE